MDGEPRKQHVISKALLRRFSTPDEELISYDLRYGKSRPRNLSAVAYQLDFVAFEAHAAERLWGQVEDDLPRALNALDNGQLFETPGFVETLKGTIVLHFIRRQMVKDLANERQAFVREKFFTRPDLPTITDEMKSDLLEWFDGQLAEAFSENLREMYLRALADAAQAGLEIWTAEIPLVLGDAAILTSKGSEIGFVPFIEAGSHALPVGRRHLIALGPKNAVGTMPAEKTRELNRQQMRQAKSHAFIHPDDNRSPFINDAHAEYLRRRPPLVSE
ncbi:DUF4238 domain-containing protein [Agreia pratensis]|uniref:DUF4238 domain-containing protein n=1 Tax=Agreia pratensis TaxID=150121 RepID=UPI00188D0DE2|nr:DUF4238 domain-containing protein [Agreia pratensis]MBF4634672.1 DUF4238 domain-containing protein [Agreia pratensis]